MLADLPGESLVADLVLCVILEDFFVGVSTSVGHH